jgi:hypothetical protein
VNVAPGLEMLRAPVIVERVKFKRWLLINGDLPHANLGGNIDSIPEQLSP